MCVFLRIYIIRAICTALWKPCNSDWYIILYKLYCYLLFLSVCRWTSKACKKKEKGVSRPVQKLHHTYCMLGHTIVVQWNPLSLCVCLSLWFHWAGEGSWVNQQLYYNDLSLANNSCRHYGELYWWVFIYCRARSSLPKQLESEPTGMTGRR